MINLIPRPQNIEEKEGSFCVSRNKLTISLDQRLSDIRDIISDYLKVSFTEKAESPDFKFIYDEKEKKDGYSLEVTTEGVKVFACDKEGAFYALSTIRQLFLTDKKGEKLESSCVKIINDSPLYSWRGLQLDESRHFFGKETVKKLLDYMALYKLNRFHWHLTDDQGWRIEIKKYPLLTETGSKRKGSQLHSWKSTEMDNTPYGGYYTQQDIKEIVDYAAERQIEIMPEIDFPAHCAAAIAAYNNLACREIPAEVFDFCGGNIPESRGIKNWNRTLCLGKREVITFVTDVIDEVCELFPFEYFHIGGDEAPTTEWKHCSLCQQRMKENSLKNETDLQGWFTNKINAHLKAAGKITVGWNEILKSNIDKDIVAQYWTPQKDTKVNAHLKNGGKVILSKHKYFYFDMLHTYCTAKLTYNFSYKNVGIPSQLKENILGIEGENWTEWTRTENELFFKIAHRAAALAEAAWTQKQSRSYKSFTARLTNHKRILDALDIYYGADFLTMKKNKAKKARLSKKHGFTIGDFDSEYRLSLIYKD